MQIGLWHVVTVNCLAVVDPNWAVNCIPYVLCQKPTWNKKLCIVALTTVLPDADRCVVIYTKTKVRLVTKYYSVQFCMTPQHHCSLTQHCCGVKFIRCYGLCVCNPTVFSHLLMVLALTGCCRGELLLAECLHWAKWVGLHQLDNPSVISGLPEPECCVCRTLIIPLLPTSCKSNDRMINIMHNLTRLPSTFK